jgi:dihydroneopterin aldolase
MLWLSRLLRWAEMDTRGGEEENGGPAGGEGDREPLAERSGGSKWSEAVEEAGGEREALGGREVDGERDARREREDVDGERDALRESDAGGWREREELEEAEEEDEEEGGEESLESISIEISGLSLYTHHGVSEAEREVGQRLVLDVRLELGEVDATATDRIEDTVDYAEVCELVTLIAQQQSHRTLERLCGRIADRLLDDYELEGVWVKIAKPEPPIPLPVDEVSVEIWRQRGE